MKRTVKAWWTLLGGRPIVDKNGVPMIRLKRSDIVGWAVVPCTITYDDGVKPKRRGKPHA